MLVSAAAAASRLPGEVCQCRRSGLGFTWEQLSPGQQFRTLNRTITETDLVMFTGVTGMLEVIFTDHTFGAEKGRSRGSSCRRR